MAQLKLDELCKRAELAVRLGSTDYTIAVCQHILSYFPKHVQARVLLGQAFLEQGSLAKAAEQFKVVLDVDPENVLARSGLGVVYGKLGELPAAIEQFERAYQINPNNADLADGLRQLYAQRDGEHAAELKIPVTAIARLHTSKKQYTLAVKELEEVLSAQPGRIEIQLARAEALWRAGSLQEAERACMLILQKAPNTLKAKLMLAEVMMRDRTREKQGLALLHDALGVDPGGRLAKGLFKDTSFMVPDLADELDLPAPDGGIAVPPEVEAAISLLPKGVSIDSEAELPQVAELELQDVVDIADPKALVAPDILRVQAELDRISNLLQQGERPELQIPRQTGISTAELILTSKKRIIAKYGEEAFDRLDRKLQEFGQVLESANIDARIVYVDDDLSLERYNLRPVDPENPEQIRAVVDSLDKNLQQNGRDACYVLIVGGDTIIPFYRLSNPVQDDDEYLLSDNPYASRDADFIIPERAVGRMPDAEEAGIGFVLAQLEIAMAHRHEPRAPARPLGCLAFLLSLGISVKFLQFQSNSFGYSALIWKNASASVFEAIGNPKKLLTSPPITDEVFDVNFLLGSGLNYFNLHGTKDSENWYGQKDLTYPEDYPMLPLALSPATIGRASVASSVVFTEACYGAYIIGKSPKTSMALRFLADGALAFVGSTVTSYGVPAPPLSNADLLGVHFWHHLADGLSLGQALMKAKVTFTNEMTERQGWLDGDDQKTLLQFVLYGDPSSYLDKAPEKKPKMVHQPAVTVSKTALRSRVCIYCKHPAPVRADAEIPVDLIQKVVRHLYACCPEMHGASVKLQCSVGCNKQCVSNAQCGAGGLHSHGRRMPQKLTHFTSRRPIPTADGKEVPRFARATVNLHGDVIKTTVSR